MRELPFQRGEDRLRELDLRLVLGVLLVLGSVLLGARVVAAADATVPRADGAFYFLLDVHTRLRAMDVVAPRLAAAGAGMNLALCCDMRLASTTASLLTRPRCSIWSTRCWISTWDSRR